MKIERPSMLDHAISLRKDALLVLMGLQEFADLLWSDDAVVAAGGAALWDADSGTFYPMIDRNTSGVNKLKFQGDFAYVALKAKGHPLLLGELISDVILLGCNIGEERVKSFRVMLSNDKRFRSVARGTRRYWWLVDREPPETWV